MKMTRQQIAARKKAAQTLDQQTSIVETIGAIQNGTYKKGKNRSFYNNGRPSNDKDNLSSRAKFRTRGKRRANLDATPWIA